MDGSGGGSINIFYKKEYTNSGVLNADGVICPPGTGYGSVRGGAGGNGSVCVGSIKSGTFEKNDV